MALQASVSRRGGTVVPPALLEAAASPCVEPQDTWVTGLTKAEAEELLDWLEAHGRAALEIVYDPAAGFSVHCR